MLLAVDRVATRERTHGTQSKDVARGGSRGPRARSQRNASADRLSPTARRARDGEVRIRACGEIIDTKTTSRPLRWPTPIASRAGAYAARAAHERGDRRLQRGLAPEGRRQRNPYYGRGQARLALNQVDGAISDFTQAIRFSGQSPGLYVARGYAQLVKGDADEAIADFTVAIRLDPKNASAPATTAVSPTARRATSTTPSRITPPPSGINPIYALAYNNRGYVFEVEGRQGGNAAADFRRALALDPVSCRRQEGLEAAGRAGSRLRPRADQAHRSRQAACRAQLRLVPCRRARPATAPTRARRAGAICTSAIRSRRCASR